MPATAVRERAAELLPAWWDRLAAGFARVEPPGIPLWLPAAVVAAAALLSVPRAGWRWFGLLVTFVHELGHAFAALSTGQRLQGIELRFDHSGQVRSLGRGRASAAWTGFWGYPAPAVAGAALTAAALTGWAPAALSVSALVLLAALLFIRNLQGAVIAVGCAASAVLLVWFSTPRAAAVVCLALGLALLVGAVRDWFKVLRVHLRPGTPHASDAWILARRTRFPAAGWLALFAAVIAAGWAGAVLAYLHSI